MYVTTDSAQAKKWAELSLANASANSFYPVDDDKAENLFNAIGAEDYACTWVYKNKNESTGENYGICVNMYLKTKCRKSRHRSLSKKSSLCWAFSR